MLGDGGLLVFVQDMTGSSRAPLADDLVSARVAPDLIQLITCIKI